LKERFSVHSVQEGRKKTLVPFYIAKKNSFTYFRYSSQIRTLTTVVIHSRAETKYSNEDREFNCFGRNISVQMITHLEQGNINSFHVKT